MRELGLAGLVALIFGLGSYYATDELGSFSAVNLVLGALALAAAGVAAARRLRGVGGPHSRPVVLRGLLLVAAALLLAVGAERGVAALDLRYDWTFEKHFELSPELRGLLAGTCAGIGPDAIAAELFFDQHEPRIRRSRMFLDEVARAAGGCIAVRMRNLREHPDEADRFGVIASDTVVLRRGERWERIERLHEAALYEGLFRLARRGAGRLLLLRGEGEGSPVRDDPPGYAGLVEALVTEGYAVDVSVSASLGAIPEETDAVLVLGPRRPFLPHTLEALRRYLEAGGRLVVWLEPGSQSGIEALLAERGIEPLPGLVIDPASGPAESGHAWGLDVIAFNYEVHPITRGLGSDQVTYFPGARPLQLRRAQSGDRITRLVLSSPRAWQERDLTWLERRSGRPEPGDARRDYQTLVAAGEYPRDGRAARIVVFGDAGLASNQYLRAVYNLDLVLNAVHWAASQETRIALRPKAVRTAVQFPLPLTSSVRAFYGVGMLLPELLLLAGGLVWLRRRAG